uniref:Uncharacterized protein n=1 Tax=Tetranychus urticae TaxID=32264 RepID=T1KYW2_TETUR
MKLGITRKHANLEIAIFQVYIKNSQHKIQRFSTKLHQHHNHYLYHSLGIITNISAKN